MAIIKTAHDLAPAAQTEARPLTDGSQGFSRYSYLFEARAASPDAGLFPGTSEAGTIERLKTFEVASRPSYLPKPVLQMRLPPVYTYFGQFVNHDLSAPVPLPSGGAQAAAETRVIGNQDLGGLDKAARADVGTILTRVVNAHEAPLTLASLYADGPHSRNGAVRALYAEDGMRFRLAPTRRVTDAGFLEQKVNPGAVLHARRAWDIPRADREPQIADLRNDGNLVLCQLHLAMMLLHNKIVDAVAPGHRTAEDCFGAARGELTQLYHWLVLNDFLPNLLSRAVVSRPLATWKSRLRPDQGVPMEFSTAAFRFGHSMVGQAYDFNGNFGNGGRISTAGATLKQLFDFTSRNNMEAPGEAATLQLPDHWVVDWDRMSRPTVAGTVPNPGGAERIDLQFAPDMLNIVGASGVVEHGSIMFRNLMRGFHRRMPFGQDLADACGVPRLLPEEVLSAIPAAPAGAAGLPDLRAVAQDLGFAKQTPAWLYCLCEAEVREQGQRVGPTASHIIADTLVALVARSPTALPRHPGDGLLAKSGGPALTTIRDLVLYAVKGHGNAEADTLPP